MRKNPTENGRAQKNLNPTDFIVKLIFYRIFFKVGVPWDANM